MNPLSDKSIEAYRTLLKSKASDVLLTPVLSKETLVLEYKDGVLVNPEYSEMLKRSRVPKVLWAEDKTFGGRQFSRIRVKGYVTEYANSKWFIASGIKVNDPKVKCSTLLWLGVLKTRGFLTVLKLCSWVTVKGTSKRRELPRTKKELEGFAAVRLKRIRQVLKGKRPTYWNPEYSEKRKSVLPAKDVIRLQVAVW